MRALKILILTILVTACSSAQRAIEVSSIRLPITPYLKMSCKALVSAHSQLIRDAQSMSAEVDSTYRHDKDIQHISWVVWPVAFFINGNQEQASKLAAIKGQGEAVQLALEVNECVS